MNGAEGMGLARSGIAYGDQVGAGLDPVSGRERLHARPRHARQSFEIEGGEGLAAG